jgi:hypothetical protein
VISDARGIGESLEQVVAQVRALGSMRFVDHQDDAIRAVDRSEGLARWHGQVSTQRFGHGVGQRLPVLLELVDHHHADVRAVGRQMLSQARTRLDHVYPTTNQHGGIAQLFFQVLPSLTSTIL